MTEQKTHNDFIQRAFEMVKHEYTEQLKNIDGLRVEMLPYLCIENAGYEKIDFCRIGDMIICFQILFDYVRNYLL